jgi:hypothetical protein
MTKGLFISIFGAGGSWLDPVGGQRAIVAQAKTRDLVVLGPFQYTDTQAIFDAIVGFARANPGLPIFTEGDSCGANVIQQIIADLAPIKVDYACFIQASVYCNFDYPDIKPNCGKALVIFSDWAHTGGLGVFIPKLEAGNKTTVYRQKYIPAAHPDDGDPLVHTLLFADVDAILNAYAGQA